MPMEHMSRFATAAQDAKAFMPGIQSISPCAGLLAFSASTDASTESFPSQTKEQFPMFVQILPWLIVVALVGLTLGLVLGMCLASKLVGGHSLHIQRLNHSQGHNS